MAEDLFPSHRFVAIFTLATSLVLFSARAADKPAGSSCFVDSVPASVAPEDREMSCDSQGLIVQQNADGTPNGGDTAQREGWYWLGVWIRNHTPGMPRWTRVRKVSFDEVLKLLEPKKDGVFYRHPTQAPFNNPYDKEWGFSRDQMVPLVAAMGMYNKQAEIRRLYEAMPMDLQGKHTFNGNWRNALGQDGMDCSAILKRGCDATSSCPLEVDTRDCSAKVDSRECSAAVDNRDCSLQTDTRDCSLNIDKTDCSLQQDTRSCGHDVLGVHVNDPFCEGLKAGQNAGYAVAKATCESNKAAKNLDYARLKATCESGKAGQNALYSSQKATCEGSKSSQNGIYAAQKADCEAQKVAQNGLYTAEKGRCEAEKGSQNVIYAGQKASCEAAKTAKKYACEVDKQLAFQTCRLGNIFNGDLLGPSDVNLFRRALKLNAMAVVDELTTPTVVQGGPPGEAELLTNSEIRVAKSNSDMDDVGDDLNHIVRLLMSQLRSSSGVGDFAVHTYAGRSASFGSYMSQYYLANPLGQKDMLGEIKQGIWSGWQPEGSASFGAVRWYHRPVVGANPMLAKLYKPIIEKYIN